MFKFGANNIAKKFGYDLAEKFISALLTENNFTDKQYVVLPSAYSYIPTASFYMKNYFVYKFNRFLMENNMSPLEEAKIYRTVTYKEDYGEMTAEQRYKLISGDKFYIDKSILNDKILIHIDDIKITGTHERIILKMFDEFNIDNTSYLLYFAQSDSGLDPKIENYLNYYFVKSLNEIDYIIKNEDFVFNTRVVKYILNSNYEEYKSFIEKQDNTFITDLYYKAIGNSYHLFDAYQANLKRLKDMVNYIEKEEKCRIII
jgi:hypothetical protein